MTLRKKDGKPFKLRGPNPVMRDQEFWDGTNYTLHNFDAEEELQNVPVEEVFVPVKEIPVKKPVEVKVADSFTIKVPCLPATSHETVDPVYGETKINTTYGDKLDLVCEVVESGDLSCTVTTDTHLERGSILFFPDQRRWWKVSEIDGKTLRCGPSDLHPSFN